MVTLQINFLYGKVKHVNYLGDLLSGKEPVQARIMAKVISGFGILWMLL